MAAQQLRTSNPSSRVSPDAMHKWMDRTSDMARREPRKAVAAAFGAGFLLNVLPIGGIIGGLVTLAFALARPLLLTLGLWKAFELYRENNQPKS